MIYEAKTLNVAIFFRQQKVTHVVFISAFFIQYMYSRIRLYYYDYKFPIISGKEILRS